MKLTKYKNRRIWIFSFACTISLCVYGLYAFSEEVEKHTVPTEIQVGMFYNSAKDYVEKGQINKAIEAITKALTYNQLTFDLLLFRGNLFLKQDNTEAASRDFTKALEIDPNRPEGYVAQASVLVKKGRHEEFVEALTKAIDLNPKIGRNFHLRAIGLLEVGEPQKALNDLKQAINLGENNSLIYQELGYSFERLGRYQEARTNYSISLELDPQNDETYGRRAWVNKCLGEYEQSIKDFSVGLSKNPENSDLRFQRAGTFMEAKNFTEALNDMEIVMTHDFFHPFLHLNSAHIYYNLGELDKAFEENSKAFSSTEPEVRTAAFFQKGLFLIERGQIDEAKSSYETGVNSGQETRSVVAFENAIIDLQETIKNQKKPIQFRQQILNKLLRVSERLKPLASPNPDWCQNSAKQIN